MILILKKLSLKKSVTLQLSLHKLAILYYLTATQFIINKADLQQSLDSNFIPFIPVQEMGNLAGMRNLNIIFCYRNHQQKQY